MYGPQLWSSQIQTLSTITTLLEQWVLKWPALAGRLHVSCHREFLLSSWRNLVLRNSQLSPASVRFLAIFLRLVSRTELRNIDYDLRFLVLTFIAISWATSSSVKMRFCVSFSTWTQCHGLCRGTGLLSPSISRPGVLPQALAFGAGSSWSSTLMSFSKTLHIKG